MNIEHVKLTEKQTYIIVGALDLLYEANNMDGEWACQGFWVNYDDPRSVDDVPAYIKSGPYGYLYEAAEMALYLALGGHMSHNNAYLIARDTMTLHNDRMAAPQRIDETLNDAIDAYNARR